MKANEIEDGKVLMIGDLVIGCIETDIVGEATYKIPCKVTDIYHCGDVICEPLKSFPDGLDWQEGDDFSWIEAIPLTKEILEKNGFKLREGCTSAWDWGNGEFSVHISGTPDCPIGQTLTIYTPGGTVGAAYSSHRTLSDYKFRGVHVFQHALRLCGLKELADNFNVE